MYSVEATGYTKMSGTVQIPTSGSITLQVEMGAYVPPPVPPASGEEIIGQVGPSCDLLAKYMFGQRWYSYRQRYTGFQSPWDSEWDDARRAAWDNKSCYLPPPPPPKTADDVQKDVDILRGTLQGISSRVQDLISSVTEMGKVISDIGKAIVDLEARIKAWIEEQIIELLLRALDREAVKYGR